MSLKNSWLTRWQWLYTLGRSCRLSVIGPTCRCFIVDNAGGSEHLACSRHNSLVTSARADAYSSTWSKSFLISIKTPFNSPSYSLIGGILSRPSATYLGRLLISLFSSNAVNNITRSSASCVSLFSPSRLLTSPMNSMQQCHLSVVP